MTDTIELIERCNRYLKTLCTDIYERCVGSEGNRKATKFFNENLLFFDKGTPTKQVWFFEHPYPEGYKSYSRSKPLTIEEFDLEKKWWKKRKENQYAWKVTVKEIEERNYNLDFKNPHVVDIDHGDPDELMKEYEEISKQIIVTRDMLKQELIQALGGK